MTSFGVIDVDIFSLLVSLVTNISCAGPTNIRFEFVAVSKHIWVINASRLSAGAVLDESKIPLEKFYWILLNLFIFRQHAICWRDLFTPWNKMSMFDWCQHYYKLPDYKFDEMRGQHLHVKLKFRKAYHWCINPGLPKYSFFFNPSIINTVI